MTRIMTLLCLGLLALLVALPAQATDDGTVADGYTYHNGYWWSGHNGYSRAQQTYQTAGHYSYGCYYPGSTYSSWVYTYVPTAKYAADVPTPADPGWRAKLLEVAAARDKANGELQKAQAEGAEYLAALKQLGIPQPAAGLTGPTGYGSTYTTTSTQIGNYGASGNTLYGYGISDAYGTTDPMVLYQQAAALAKNAQDLGGQATQQFGGLVTQTATARERLALAQAALQANTAIINAANPPQSSTTVQQSTFSSGQQVSQPGVVPFAQQQTFGSSQQVPLSAQAQAACIQCHGGAAKRGGYDVRAHRTLSPEKQREVVGHLVADPADTAFMPRLPGGGPGVRLPAALIAEFMPPADRAKLGQ